MQRVTHFVVPAAVVAILLVAGAIGRPADVAFGAFHCMRIHAVKFGFAGNANVQYVELRMDVGGQSLLSGHTVEFRDGSDTLKATFTFPANVTNALTGDSILIASPEFAAYSQGGAADFTFSNANTVGANGGDPLHPVQAPNGKVIWSPGSANCNLTTPVDSVASGTAPADYGSAAVALPAATDSRALRLSNLNTAPANNSTEYSLQPIATSSSMVATGNLATDFSTPRNNARQVIKLAAPASVGGVAQLPEVVGTAPLARSSGGDGVGVAWYALAAAAALLAGGAAAIWRRRASAASRIR